MRPSVVYFLIATVTYLPVRLLFRLRARGLENVPAEGGGRARREPQLEPRRVGARAPRPSRRRWLRFMAKSELYWFPLKYVVQAAGAFQVRRGEGDTEAIRTAVELCRGGEIVVMFPEGTRRRKGFRKTREARAHTGAARIAREAGVPLVPAAIRGTDRLSRLGPFRVDYGEPVAVGDDPVETTDRLMAAIASLGAAL